jgi:hypothetical protein
MNALEKYASKQHLLRELTKVALKMSDVERNMGMYLDKKHHGKVKEMMEERKKKSFALRHPVLTGIPTLGLAPAIAKARAAEKIKRKLVREDKGLRGAYEKSRDKKYARRMEEARLMVEHEKAQAPVRAAGTAAAAYLAGKQMKYGRD